ncbi:MAG: hypothetical protein IPK88_04860 [Saprospiraceae bacterium]|nr:hypothetical protein [Candidatus Defluviibacterium haderslevense]
MIRLAHITSYLLHPLFILLYNSLLLMCLKPHWFGIHHVKEAGLLILLILIYTIIIPIIGILLLRFIGLIKTIQLEDKMDRIAPLIICIVFYLWLYINLKQNPDMPKAFLSLILGSIISLCLAFVINNWVKVSLHTIAMGGLICFWLIIRYYFCTDDIMYFRFKETEVSRFHIHQLLGISLILGGWIGTSRLFLKAHTSEEIYLGYVIGIISIIIAFKYMY